MGLRRRTEHKSLFSKPSSRLCLRRWIAFHLLKHGLLDGFEKSDLCSVRRRSPIGPRHGHLRAFLVALARAVFTVFFAAAFTATFATGFPSLSDFASLAGFS